MEVCYTWVLDHTNALPMSVNKLEKFNRIRKEVNSILLNNSFYIFKEYLLTIPA